jgi:hypothetical protein
MLELDSIDAEFEVNDKVLAVAFPFLLPLEPTSSRA